MLRKPQKNILYIRSKTIGENNALVYEKPISTDSDNVKWGEQKLFRKNGKRVGRWFWDSYRTEIDSWHGTEKREDILTDHNQPSFRQFSPNQNIDNSLIRINFYGISGEVYK